MSTSRSALARAALAAALLAAHAASAQTTPYPGIGRPATAKELAAWDIDVRPDFKGLPAGSGSVAKGQDVWEAKCASCHGVFGESNEVFNPIVGGTTKEDIASGRVAKLRDPAFPGRTTLMKVSTRLDAVGLHQPRDAVEPAQDPVGGGGVRGHRVHPQPRRRRAGRLRALRPQHRRGAEAPAQPQRQDPAARDVAGHRAEGPAQARRAGLHVHDQLRAGAEGRVDTARLRAQRARQPRRPEPARRRRSAARTPRARPSSRRPPRPPRRGRQQTRLRSPSHRRTRARHATRSTRSSSARASATSRASTPAAPTRPRTSRER